MQLCVDGQTSDGSDLVGRGIHVLTKRQENMTCHECCTSDLCNDDLCTFKSGKYIYAIFAWKLLNNLITYNIIMIWNCCTKCPFIIILEHFSSLVTCLYASKIKQIVFVFNGRQVMIDTYY